MAARGVKSAWNLFVTLLEGRFCLKRHVRRAGRQGLALAPTWHEYLIMVTDRPPRAKALLTKFAASDQLGGLPLPGDDRMRLAAAAIEAAMKGGARTAVQGA